MNALLVENDEIFVNVFKGHSGTSSIHSQTLREGAPRARVVVPSDDDQAPYDRTLLTGDIARWPDPHTGRDIRVEHGVVAQRQGQAAANRLGRATRFAEVPFFWSKHFDLSPRRLGHAGEGSEPEVDGVPAKRDATVIFARDGRLEAVATMGRDLESPRREAAMERAAAAG